MEGFSGPLKVKGAPLATAATAWQSVTYCPGAEFLDNIHALLLMRRRREARNRSLGMLRLGQATKIPSSWAVQWAPWGLRVRIGRPYLFLSVLRSYPQRVNWICASARSYRKLLTHNAGLTFPY